MSEPILIQNDPLTPLNTASSTNSDPIVLTAGVGYCIMTFNSGNAIGSAVLQVSPDGPTSLYQPGGIWFTLTGTELAVDGTGNSNTWNIERAMYPYARIHYTSTSGTGSMYCFVSVKNS